MAHLLEFERYALDLDRGCLLRDGGEVALRPKTFAVLQFLVDNAGRLVSKEEVFASVWPDVAVTDDVLVQSIGELRRVFGSDGHRLIKTIPRRGYRLDAHISERAHAPSHKNPDNSSIASSSSDRGETKTGLRDAQVVGPPLVRQRLDPRKWIRGLGRLPSRNEATELISQFWRGSSLVHRLFAAAVISLILAASTISLAWVVSGSRGHLDAEAPGRTRLRIAALKARPTIAVLPFANLSNEQASAYLSDGLTQDVINALGRFSALTVMSWNAVQALKDSPAVLGDVASRLGARYYVEGSVRRAEGRIRTTVQLATADGRVLWSGRFDDTYAGVFSLQDKIVTHIAGALAIRLTQVEQYQALAKPSPSLEAYDYVLRARPALQRPSRANNVEARALLRRAVQTDPRYAAAHAALAETFYIAVSWGWTGSPSSFLKSASDAAQRALEIDDADVRARIVLGRVALVRHDFEQAQVEIERAIAINPSDADALAGRGNILLWLGRTDEAIDSLEFAQRINPELSAIDGFSLALAYYLKGQYKAAVARTRLNLRLSPSASFNHVVQAIALAQLGETGETAKAAQIAELADPTFDPASFGNKLRKAADLAHLRAGLVKAGFSVPLPSASRL